MDEAAAELQAAADGLEHGSQNSGDTENRDPENTDGNGGKSGQKDSNEEGDDGRKSQEAADSKVPKTGDNVRCAVLYMGAVTASIMLASYIFARNKRNRCR